MKKTILNLFILLVSNFALGQTTNLINYNFNSASGYPIQPTFNETGISCSATSTESFQTYTGANTGSQAFIVNSTAGNAIGMANSTGNNSKYFQFHLSGNELNLCSSYKLYFQSLRNSNGASLITVAYSTDGVNFTNHGTTYNVALNFTETVVNLTSVSTINNVSNLYIRLQCSGAISSTGTIRIDNFQVQANKTTSSGGGGNNPWQVNGNDVSFIGKVGIGNTTPLFPLDVTGDAKISNNVNIAGAINIGNLSDSISIGTALAPNGARIITLGKTRPTFPFPLPTTCMEPLQPGNLGLSNRVVLANSPSQNLLDFTNTGSNGLIDYGFDINQFRVFDPNNPALPRPALKINSKCWGDVELAKGGGFVSTGNYFEVGNPVRNGNITSHINAISGRIGQRITVSSQFPENFANFPAQYNSQFFVNRTKTRALAVFNTLNSPEGEETFSVYGDGRVAIGSSYVANGYKLAVHGKIIAEEVVIQLRNTWPDYVFNKEYKLMPLDILEKFLTANKHLPNIPSEKELKENGISTSDMLNKQMEKIEELTLYIIDQQKQINELKKQLEAVK